MISVNSERCRMIRDHLRGKQCTAREVSDHFGWHIDTTGNYLTALVRAKLAIITREEKERGGRRTYYVFATPGEAPEFVPTHRGKPLPGQVAVHPERTVAARTRERRHNGSGVIAGPAYHRGLRWGAGKWW